MANIKILYKFFVPYVEEVEQIEESKDEKGNTVKTTRKVNKEIKRAICLKRPNRVEADDALLYYSVQVHEGMKAGMISKPLLGKMYDNDGGILSRPEVDRQNDLWVEFYRKNGEYQRLYGKPDKTPDEQTALESLIRDMMEIRRRLQDFEMMQSSVFDITAESRARTRTIIWWLVNLAHYDADYEKNSLIEDESARIYNWQPLFPGRDFDERQASRDKIEEGDDLNDDQKIFYFRAIQRAAASTALWHYGKASTQKDFEVLENEFDVELLNDVPEETEVPQVEDQPESTESVVEEKPVKTRKSKKVTS